MFALCSIEMTFICSGLSTILHNFFNYLIPVFNCFIVRRWYLILLRCLVLMCFTPGDVSQWRCLVNTFPYKIPVAMETLDTWGQNWWDMGWDTLNLATGVTYIRDIGHGMWAFKIPVMEPECPFPCQKWLPELVFSQHLRYQLCAKVYNTEKWKSDSQCP